MDANEGTARYGWMLLGAMLISAGLALIVAAMAYAKRRKKLGFVIASMGLLNLGLAMLVNLLL